MQAELPEIWLSIDSRVGMLILASTFLLILLLNVILLSPLEWWSDNFDKFPTLSELARLIFSIPGSQIECERIFSAAGLITSGLRNRLGVENLDMLVNIQKNADVPRHIKEALCAAHGTVLGEKIYFSPELKFKSETTFINEELGAGNTSDPNLNLVYGALDAMLENMESIEEDTDDP